MFAHIIDQLAKSVETIEGWLDKAAQHAAAKHFDVEILTHERLTPDMGGFIYQVQSACDYLKDAAAWLSGQTPPSHPDVENTLDEVRDRVRKTVEYARSVTASQFAEAADQRIKVSWSPKGTIATGEVYLVEVILPNVYFHLSMAYAILRQGGVDVGKMDFVGPVAWIPE